MLRRVIIFGLIFMAVNAVAFGQSRSSFSKPRMKSVYTDPSKTIYGLLDSSNVYLKSDKDKSFDFLEQAYLLSLKSENAHIQYLVYRKLGNFYEFYNQHDLAALNYENSLKLNNQKNRKTKTQKDIFIYVLKAGEQYRLAKQAEKSLEIYRVYGKYAFYERDFMLLSIANGDAYFDLEKYTLAIENYRSAEQKSLKLNLNDQNTIIKLKIAKVLAITNSDQTLVVLNQANVQSKANSNVSLQIKTETEIANYYSQNDLHVQEIASRNIIINNLDSNKVELESLNVNVSNSLMEEKINIAKTYNKQNLYDSAIVELSLVNIDYFNNDIDEETEDRATLELKKEAAKTRSEAFLKLGQEKEALRAYKQYVSLMDRLYEKKEVEFHNFGDLNKKLSDNQWRIDFLEKDKAIYDAELLVFEQEHLLYEESIKFQKWFIFGLVAIASLLGFALLMLNKRNKIQQKHNLYLDLKSLRTQMNPHFIFNALNSVNNFIAKNDELNANKYLVRFSKLMRSILDNSDSDFIPLSKEVELLELYLQLENMRFPDKFSFKFDVDKDLSIDGFQIPPMIIQPYIENAIWHGLRYKEEGGLLSVKMEKEGELLKVSVEDNGIGRKKSQELKTKNQKSLKSRGIKNTQKRLEILAKIYKQEIRMQIGDVLGNGEGTLVEVWIPNLQTEK